MNTDDFMRLVLPDAGPYCLAVNASINTWYATASDLAAAALRVGAGTNVYFAAAGFNRAANRDDLNVAQRKLFVLDVDLHGKPGEFASLTDAYVALSGFINSGQLPKPAAIVATGRGMQVHWVSPQGLDLLAWRRTNNGFMKHVAGLGDPRLTVDISTSKRASGVYRVPGTWNTNAVPHVLATLASGKGALLDATWLTTFWDLGETDAAGGAVNYASLTPTPMSSGVNTAGVFGSLEAASDLIPARETLSGCAQMGHLAATPLTADYNAWLAMARVLRHVLNGREIFHKWSSRDTARYDAAQCEAKWQEAWRMNAGVTCASVAEAAGDFQRSRCAGCPIKQNADKFGNPGSPLNAWQKVATTELDLAPPPVVIPQGFSNALIANALTPKSVVFPAAPVETDTLPAYLQEDDLHSEFYKNPRDELCKRGRSAQGTQKATLDRKIADNIFWLSAMNVSDSVDAEVTHGYTLNVYSRAKRKVFRHDVSIGDVSGEPAQLNVFLATKSVVVSPGAGPDVRDYMIRCRESVNKDVSLQNVTPNAFGWSHDKKSFVVGNTRYLGNGATEKVVIEGGALGSIQRLQGFGVHGTSAPLMRILQEVNANPDFTDDFKMRLLLPAATALIQFTVVNSVTVITRGPPNMGKTMATEIGMAVWGKGVLASGGSEDTANAVTAIANKHGSLPYGFDDLTVGDRRRADELARFTMSATSPSGTHKNRMTSNIQINEGENSWQSILFVNTNATMNELFRNYGDSMDAVRVRTVVFDINCPQSPLGTVDSRGRHDGGLDWLRATGQALKEADYGHLGAALADYLVTNYEQVKARVHDAYTAFCMKLAARDDNRFRPSLYAAAKVVGEILADITGIKGMACWTDKAIENNHSAMNRGAKSAAVAAVHAPAETMERIARLCKFPKYAHVGGGAAATLYTGSHIPTDSASGCVLTRHDDTLFIFTPAIFAPREIWEGSSRPTDVMAMLEQWAKVPGVTHRATTMSMSQVLDRMNVPAQGFWDGTSSAHVLSVPNEFIRAAASAAQQGEDE